MTTIVKTAVEAKGFLDIDHLYGTDKANEANYVTIKLHDDKRTPVAEFRANAASFLAAMFNNAKTPGLVKTWTTEEVEPIPAEPPRRADTGMTDFEQAVALLRGAVQALDYRYDRKATQAAIASFLAYLDEHEEGAA